MAYRIIYHSNHLQRFFFMQTSMNWRAFSEAQDTVSFLAIRSLRSHMANPRRSFTITLGQRPKVRGMAAEVLADLRA
jgi:hypothetical protein